MNWPDERERERMRQRKLLPNAGDDVDFVGNPKIIIILETKIKGERERELWHRGERTWQTDKREQKMRSDRICWKMVKTQQ